MSAQNTQTATRVITLVMVHYDAAFLPAVLAALAEAEPAVVLVSRVPWHGLPGDSERAAAVAKAAGALVVLGEWRSEEEHRRAGQGWALEHGFTHALIPDSDEIIEPTLLRALVSVAHADLAEQVLVEMDTYWKVFGSGECGPNPGAIPTRAAFTRGRGPYSSIVAQSPTGPV